MKKLNKYNLGLVFGLSVLVLLSGCGETDKKEVSKENFKRILNDYYSRNCVGIGVGDFPQEEKLKGQFFSNLGELEAFERLGYLKSEKIKVKEVAAFGKDKLVDAKKFTLTSEGKTSYKNKAFCVFNYEIETIDNYTEPADMMGMKVVRVNFSYKPIKSTKLLENVKKEKVLLDKIDRNLKKKSDRTELILTGMKGWIHQREFKK